MPLPNINITLDLDYVRTLLDYYPDTGLFIWRERPIIRHYDKMLNKKYAGKQAGTLQDGYIIICIDQIDYMAHRLAYALTTGQWPAGEIDHINTIKSDNRASNLRLATHGQNGANRKGNRNNTSGHKGVSWHKQTSRWRVSITHGGKAKHCGMFDTLEDAVECYARVAAELKGDFARP